MADYQIQDLTENTKNFLFVKTFCTIITPDYFPKALALYKSIRQFEPDIKLQVLVTDNGAVAGSKGIPEGINLITISELKGYSLVDELYRKYAHIDLDFFRWSLKPILISWLIEKDFEKILYLDCDMFFFNDYTFLFEELDHSSILLTPHWRNSNPLIDKDSFIALFTSGIFSGGFIGANRDALPAMRWWAEACHFMMGPRMDIGIYDDQKYLDAFPVLFEKTKIIRHRGCGVGANMEETKRMMVNGKVLINGEYPVIFVHFDNVLVQGILKGYDEHLLPYLNQYTKVFEESGSSLSDYLRQVSVHANADVIRKMKWKLKIRTRIKQALYKLSQKI